MAVRWGLEAWSGVEEAETNPQDAVIVRLLLEGVSPEEMAGLRAQHIDAESRMLMFEHRKGGYRQHHVSKSCIRLLQQALLQSKYPTALPDGTDYGLKLERSDYVVKVSLWDYVGNEALIQDPASIRLRTIYNRIRKLSECGVIEPAQAIGAADVNLVS